MSKRQSRATLATHKCTKPDGHMRVLQDAELLGGAHHECELLVWVRFLALRARHRGRKRIHGPGLAGHRLAKSMWRMCTRCLSVRMSEPPPAGKCYPCAACAGVVRHFVLQAWTCGMQVASAGRLRLSQTSRWQHSMGIGAPALHSGVEASAAQSVASKRPSAAGEGRGGGGGGVEVWLKHEDGWAARRRKTFKHSTPLPCTQQNLWYAPSAQSIFRFGSVARDQRTATICGPTRKRVAQVEAPMHQTTGHTPKASIIGPSDAPTRHIAGGLKQGWEWRR